ncbi:MAG: class I SAM-dependent methyltransferase [Alphaproteobacteria bacterium]|nr:class I SAM-dependent methyltransferase [Alphaproteobacteria bacterium]
MIGPESPYFKALDYVSNHMDQVDGFLSPLDAGLLMAIDLAQKGAGITGNLAEIGVLHGRSAFLLAHLAGSGETVQAIDIFDLYWPNPPFNLPDAFIGNALKLGVDLQHFNLVKADTTKEAGRVAQSLGKAGTRLFHIDGDHRLMHILADSKIALEATSPEGVIVFDDVFSYLMPEVTEGILKTFAGRTDFVPLALSPHKAYFCPPALKAHYAAYLIECLLNNLDTEVRRLLDHWVITFSAQKPVILRYFDQVGTGDDAMLHRHILGRVIDFPLPP